MSRDLDISVYEQDLLKAAGVTGNVFMQRPFKLDDAVGMIESTTVTGRPKIIKAAKQLESFDAIFKGINSAPLVYCISSLGNDLQAKYTAAYLLTRSLALHTKDRHNTNRTQPVWHTLTGSFQDYYRDRYREVRKGQKPAMIVLSNVVANSSDVKKEKLRDLLELFSDIPRIVPITGTDPFTFFNEDMCYPLTSALYLKRGNLTLGRRGQPPAKRKPQEEKVSDDNFDPDREEVTVKKSAGYAKPRKKPSTSARTKQL